MASSSSASHTAGGTASTTPWRSGYADPPVHSSNAHWKNKAHHEVQKVKVDFNKTPRLNWREWHSRLNGLLQGRLSVDPIQTYDSTWQQDGMNGRPLGLLVQISKILAYQLRHNLPSFGSYNKRTGTIDLQELFQHRQFAFVRALPDLFYQCCMQNPKNRFVLHRPTTSDGTDQILISAAQGHGNESAPSKEDTCTRITPEGLGHSTRWVIHGTTMQNAQSIIQSRHIYPGGVAPSERRPSTRKDVHWSWAFPQTPGEQIYGLRSPSEVYIFLNIRQFLREGGEVWEASNRVLLTGEVHIRHFWCILDATTGKDVRTSSYNSYDVPDHILVQFHTFRVNTFNPDGPLFKASKAWMINWQKSQEARLVIPSAESLPPLNMDRMNGSSEPFELESDEEDKVEAAVVETDEPDWSPEGETEGTVANPELGVSGSTASEVVFAPQVLVDLDNMTLQEKFELVAYKKNKLVEDYLQLDFDTWWEGMLSDLEAEVSSDPHWKDRPTVTTMKDRMDQAARTAVESVYDLEKKLTDTVNELYRQVPRGSTDEDHERNTILSQYDAEPIFKQVIKQAVERLRAKINLPEGDTGEHVLPQVLDDWGNIRNPPQNPETARTVTVPVEVLRRANRPKEVIARERQTQTVDFDVVKDDIRQRFYQMVSSLPTKGSIYRVGEEQDVVNKDQLQFNLLLANFGNIFRQSFIGGFRFENRPERTGKVGVLEYNSGEFNLLYRVWADNMATVILTCEAKGLDHPDVVETSQWYGLKGSFTEQSHLASCHVRAGTRGTSELLEEFYRADGEQWLMYGGIFRIGFGEHHDPKERGRAVTRAGLSNPIVGVYHINNDFCNKMARVRQVFHEFMDLAFKYKADIIGGDANKAGLRYYNRQAIQDPWNSSVCVLIRNYVEAYNQGKELHRQIGVQEYNNTRPDDLAALQNLDCMWVHIFSWGKTPMQQAVRAAIGEQGLERARSHRDSTIAKGAKSFPLEWKVNIHEKAIALDRYELGLGPRDNESHRPLLLFISEAAMANKRDRTSHSSYYRHLTYSTKESAANKDIRWAQAREAVQQVKEQDQRRGWYHPHQEVRYRRDAPVERSQPSRSSHDPAPATGETPYRARSRSYGEPRTGRPRTPPRRINTPPRRPQSPSHRSPSRQRQPDNRQSGSWEWEWKDGRWTWSQAAWANWYARGARGQNPDEHAQSDMYMTWFTILMIIVGTIATLQFIRNMYFRLVRVITSYVDDRQNGKTFADQSTQAGECSHAWKFVHTTAYGGCIHLFRDCSSLTANQTTIVQDRTMCSICSARFDEHYVQQHPGATFCRYCKIWFPSDQEYLAHLNTPEHRIASQPRRR